MAETLFQKCIEKTVKDPGVKSGLEAIYATLPDTAPKTIKLHETEIHDVLALGIFQNCRDELFSIAQDDPDSVAEVPMVVNGKNKNFKIRNAVIDSIQTPIGILVTNKTKLRHNEMLKLSDLPKKEKFFPAACSPHRIWYNLDDDAAVNKAGQKLFYPEHEYFLDFAEGDNRRAFPGLVLMDRTSSPTEEIIVYYSIREAIAKTKEFHKLLQNTACANSGLAVYAVFLAVRPDETIKKGSEHEMTGGKVAVVVGGAGVAWLGTSSALAATGIATATSTGLAALLYGTAASTSWVPIAGWIVSAVAVVGGTIALMWPQKIQLLDQVMVLDGPFRL